MTRALAGFTEGIDDKIARTPILTDPMSLTPEIISNALRELIDPVLDQSYVESKSAKNIKIDGADVSLEIVLGYPARAAWKASAGG